MRALSALAGLALAAALAGCSDDGDSGEKEPAAKETPTTQAPSSDAASSPAGDSAEAAVEAAYRKYVDAFLTGDGSTAYNLQSDRCKALMSLPDFTDLTKTASDAYGLVEYQVLGVTIDSTGRAKVNAKFPVAGLDQGGGSEWIREGGAWRTDKCD